MYVPNLALFSKFSQEALNDSGTDLNIIEAEFESFLKIFIETFHDNFTELRLYNMNNTELVFDCYIQKFFVDKNKKQPISWICYLLSIFWCK